jgi:hypothetical protein
MTKMDKLGTEPGAARDELAALQPIELHPVTARLGTAEDGTRRVTPASSIPGRAHGAYASGSGGSGGLPRIRSDAFSGAVASAIICPYRLTTQDIPNLWRFSYDCRLVSSAIIG